MSRSDNITGWEAAIAQVDRGATHVASFRGIRSASVETADDDLIASIIANLIVPSELNALVTELAERVRHSPDKSKAAHDARATLERLIQEYESKSNAELMEVKAHDSHRADLTKAHRELFATDAVYRAKTMAIAVQGDARVDAADQRQQDADHLAAQYGITTEHDDEVAEARRRYEAARLNIANDAAAARDAELEWHRLRMLQTQEREKQLREGGHVDAADRMHDHGRTIDKDFTDAMDDYDKQAKALRDAKRDQLKEAGLTAAEKQKEMAEFEDSQKAARDELWNRMDVSEAREETKDIKMQLNHLLAAAEPAPAPFQTEPRYEVAQVSRAEPRTPSPAPAQALTASSNEVMPL